MQRLKVALDCEFRGENSKALELYKDVLQRNANDANAITSAKNGIKRLSGIRKRYFGVNKDRRDIFISMQTEDEFLEFERWLMWVK